MHVKTVITNTTKAIHTKTIAAASLCLLAMTALSPNTAYAACSNNMDGEAGVAGEIEFFTPDNVLRYCDDTNWVDMVYKGPIPPDSSSIVNFFSDFFAPPAPTTEYTANAVNFDGTNDYLRRGSDMTGAADSKLLTFSFWLRLADTASGAKIIYNNTGSAILLYANGSSISFGLKNSAGTTITNARITNTAVANEWYHVLVSVDMADTASSSMYLNDEVSGTFFSPNPFIDENIAISKAEHSIGSAANTTQKFNGDLADIWIDYDTFIDFSVEANRRKFISASGYPVNLNADGSLPTGAPPDIFLSGDTATWHTNKGTGGGFTEGGALTDGPSVTPNGLVAHYKLDETSGTTAIDFTANGYNSTMSGGMTAAASTTNGVFNNSFNFNGVSNKLLVPNTLGTSLFGSPISFSAWIYNEGENSDSDAFNSQHIISFIHDIRAVLYIRESDHPTNPNSLLFLLDDSGGEKILASASNVVKQNSWMHVAGVNDGVNSKIYLNGIQIGSLPAGTPDTPLGSNRGIAIGGSTDGTSEFNGSIDDVRIYNRAISDDEITALYDLGKERASLIGHFKLDETSGTTGIDSSILANNGTYINGVTPATDTKDGVYDNAINFYSDVSVSNKELKAPSNDTYTNTSELTYAAWIKPRDFGGHRGIIELVDNAHMKTYFSTDDLSFGVEAWDDGFHEFRAATSIPPNEWTHVAVTYSYNDTPTTAPKFYINGNLFTGYINVPNISTSTYTLPATSAAVVGRVEWNGSGKNFNGLVDDARIYNRVLTAAEIQELYNDANLSLVAHYKLDETSGTTAIDSSVTGNNATATGSNITLNQSGIIEKSAVFGANSAYIVPHNAVYEDLDQLTLSAWVKDPATGTLSFIDKNNDFSFQLNSANNRLQFAGARWSTTSGIWRTPNNTLPLETDSWYHVAVTYDTSNLTNDPLFYVNGDLVSTTEQITPAGVKKAPGSLNLFLGNQNNLANPLGGNLDDVRIYNRILSADEIKALTKTGTGGLIAHYKLDETSGTTAADSSIYNNDAAMNGGLDANNNRVDGPMNTALEFDGVNDKINLTNPNLVLGTAPKFSVMAWIKPNEINNSEVFNWGSGSGKSPSIQFNSNALRFGITGSRIDAAMTDMGIAENKWSHVTITYDGTTGRIYGNGILVESDTLNLTEIDDGTIEIGGGPSYFNGAIDDVKIYDRLLSVDEVLALYNAGDPPPVPNDNLLAHWEFEETSGTTATDSTGNGYDLTLSSSLTANSVTGRIDNAFDFFAAGNGSSGQANIPASFTANKQFTVAMWLRLKDIDSRQQGFFGSSNWFRIMNYFGNRVIFNTQAWDTNAVVYGPTLDPNKWTHIAVSYDYDAPYTQDPIFYVDGVMASTSWQGAAPSGAYTDPADETLFVGRRVDSSSGGFSGDMDDVRFYNRILSPAEIEILAGCTGPGSYYYNFSNNNMQWCNGVNAPKDMGPTNTSGSTSSCNVSYDRANVDFISDGASLYYCNTQDMIPIGRKCTSCGGSATEKVAFVTMSAQNGNMGGLSGADAICQAEADAVGLTGTYLAWLADNTGSPDSRFSTAIKGTLPIVRTDGTTIANNWADLTDGSIDAQMNYSVYGAKKETNVSITWTNVANDGTLFNSSNTCVDWTSNNNADNGQTGTSTGTTDWTERSFSPTRDCQTRYQIYCFEQ